MFPGNRNKKILIEKLVDVKTEIKDAYLQDTESYLGNTIHEDYDTGDSKKTSFVLTKIKESSDTQTGIQTKDKISDMQRTPIDLLKKTSQYKYPIDSLLKTDYQDLKLHQDQQIMLCAYHVDTENLKPYLSYLLYNNSDNSEGLLYFPFITYNKDIDLLKQITEQFTSLTKFNGQSKVLGYIKEKRECYFFLEIPKLDIDDKRDKNYVWCLIDELVNSKKVYDIILHNSVSQLFYNNPDLIFLYDIQEIPYEVPTVVYTGDHLNVSSFNSVFGKRKESNSISSLGNLYTFYSYEIAKKKASEKANQQDIESDSTENTGGVVRYAVFAGKTKLFKKEELGDLLVSESENDWTSYYHSAYVGKITLQNGEKLADTPILVTVKYDQQIPLTLRELNN
tara:strand:- start:191 stop:1372 length:1182 start_codon:yes stop_codon:yes gene_type:complete